MPQMSPMKWMTIFLLSMFNLFIFMILVNSTFMNLTPKYPFNYDMKKWKWIW